jgi:hypothetical protein
VLITIDFSATPVSGIMYKEVSPREGVAYFKLQPPPDPTQEPEARKSDRQDYMRAPSADLTKGIIILIEGIEVG